MASLADTAIGSSASPPSSCVMNNAASVGDVIVARLVLPNASGPGTVTFSDNLGNTYVQLGNILNDTTHSRYIAHFWTTVTHAGTPTISASLGTAKTGRVEAQRWNNWQGTPTEDTSLKTTASGAATASAVTVAAAGATTHNNTLIIAGFVNGDTLSNANGQAPAGMWIPSSPTSLNGGNAFYGYSYYSPQSDAGGTVPFTFTSGSSTAYGVNIAAIYDAGSTLPAGARMRQFILVNPNVYNVGASTFTKAFPQATLAGSTIVCFSTCANDVSGSIYNPSDPVNGNYTQKVFVGPNANINIALYVMQNAGAIPATDVITLSNATGEDNFYAVVIEYTGVAASSIVAFTSNVQASVTSTSPDAVTTGTMAGGAGPGLVVGAAFDATGNNTTQENAPQPGTGFTGGPWYFWPTGSGAAGDGFVNTFEAQRFASVGSRAATFTVPYTSSDTYVTIGLVLAEATIPHQVPTPFVMPQLPPTWDAQHGAMVAPLIPPPPSPYNPFRWPQLPPQSIEWDAQRIRAIAGVIPAPVQYVPHLATQLPVQSIEWDAQSARRIAPLIPTVASYVPALRRLQQDIAALDWPAQKVYGFATTIQPTHSFSYTMSGGLVFSGSAPHSDTRIVAPAGGLLFGGTAPYSAIHSFSYTMSGGATFAGTAPLNIVRNVTPSGGLTFGGSAPVIFVQQGAGKSLLPIIGVGK